MNAIVWRVSFSIWRSSGRSAVIAQRDGAARRAGSRRSPDAMDISLGRLRQLVVDDMRHAVDIDAARGNVGGDQNPHVAASLF